MSGCPVCIVKLLLRMWCISDKLNDDEMMDTPPYGRRPIPWAIYCERLMRNFRSLRAIMVKVNGVYSSSQHASLLTVLANMPYGITQCYLLSEAGTRLSDPGGMQGWVDLVGWLHPTFTCCTQSDGRIDSEVKTQKITRPMAGKRNVVIATARKTQL